MDEVGDVLLRDNYIDKFMWIRIESHVAIAGLFNNTSWFSRRSIGFL